MNKPRTEAKKARVRVNLARNKVRRITAELKHAGGKAVQALNERLAYWRMK